MCDNVPQLLSSILLGSLSLIPNDTLRLAALGLTGGLGLFYVIHVNGPSTQLSQLEDMAKKVDELIRYAKDRCPRDELGLTQEGVRLLEIKRSASTIRCNILESNALTWKKYRLVSRDIANCIKGVRKIRTAVQLIVEAERQRKFTEDIDAKETLLSGVRLPGPDRGARGVSNDYHGPYRV
ncbi:hypothetical protein DFH06DRAFT_1486818 [Mycena polygramma]|nr:hypothetical protein DFH06DRAFT_1486818 [Mycena polygramma]